MFTLYKITPKFPKIKPVNIRFVKLYAQKFEESLKNLEELQKEVIRS